VQTTLVMAKDFEDLLIWKKALEFWEAVNALLDRPGFSKDYDLRNQIRDAIDSVLSNIPEGFEQPTDRSFAQYLFRSKASAAEVRARLLIAWRRHYIQPSDHAKCSALGIELGKMLAGFIQYLRRCDRKNRGVGRTPPAAERPPRPDSDSDFDSDSD
jgi:four helix bundle protein